MIPSDFPSHKEYIDYVKKCEAAYERWMGMESDYLDIVVLGTYFPDTYRYRAKRTYEFATGHVQSMIEVKIDDHGLDSHCGYCWPRLGHDVWMQNVRENRMHNEIAYQTSFNPDLAAERPHP